MATARSFSPPPTTGSTPGRCSSSPIPFGSNWLIELTGAELVRIFLQLENVLTADEDDIRGWVDELSGNNIFEERNAMTLIFTPAGI
jgi:hypothetical protein